MDMTKATLLSQESETRSKNDDQMPSMPPPPSPNLMYERMLQVLEWNVSILILLILGGGDILAHRGVINTFPSSGPLDHRCFIDFHDI